MIFLTIVASVGVLFLLNTLWRLFLESRKSRSPGKRAEIFQLPPRGPSEPLRIDRPRTGSAGKAV